MLKKLKVFSEVQDGGAMKDCYYLSVFGDQDYSHNFTQFSLISNNYLYYYYFSRDNHAPVG